MLVHELFTKKPMSDLATIYDARLVSIFNKTVPIVMDNLIYMLGSSNTGHRGMAKATLSAISDLKLLGLKALYDRMVLSDSSKKTNAPKMIVSRLELLHDLVNLRKTDEINLSNYALKHLKHGNNSVRMACYNLLIALYCIHGDKLTKRLQSLEGQMQYDIFMEAKKLVDVN